MAELDLELLLSLVKGLGSFLADDKGDKVYSKDEDCLGKPRLLWAWGFLHAKLRPAIV